MHLDSVVLRHYKLQRAKSSTAKSNSHSPRVEQARPIANETTNAAAQRPVAVKTPADYPPLEPVVDLRIPMHFSQFDPTAAPQLSEPATEMQRFLTTVSTMFAGLDPPFEAMVHVCCLQDMCMESESPRFVAVVTKSGEGISRWREVHSALSTAVHDWWPTWRHPAIRYLKEGKQGFPKFR